MEKSTGKFLDTNVVFDATFELRSNRKNFLKFMKDFKYKDLFVETVVTLEAIEIIYTTFELITPLIRNIIFNSDWDNLNDKKRQELLSDISNKIDNDVEISKNNRTEFAQAEYNTLFPSFLTENKENIQVILRIVPDQYTEHFRMRLEDLFEIFQAHMSDIDYSDFNSELKKLNDNKTTFDIKDSIDFKILCSLLSILQFGGQDNTYGEHHEFNNVNLYSRDSKFLTNVEKFKKLIEATTNSSYINISQIKQDASNLSAAHPYVSD